jgi:hypothetical protein
VHALATGLAATVLYLVLAGAALLAGSAGPPVVSRARVMVETAAIGVIVGGVWEAYRWLEPITGSTVPARSATDLVAHLLVDVVGALIAGAVLAVLRQPDDATDAARHPPRVPAVSHRGSIL